MRLERVALMAALALMMAGCVTERPDTPESRLREPKGSKNQDSARVFTELGQHYLQTNDLQGALTQFNKALKYDEKYEPAQTLIAATYERIHDTANAELHYRKAQGIDPARGGPNNNLGAFLCRTGRTAEGLPYFQKAVADPFNQAPSVAWINAGTCHITAGDPAAAEEDFRKALTVDPNNGEALYQLANMLYQRNDAFRASAFMQRYDALGQASPQALKLGFDIETRLGDKDAALNYRRRLQSQFPESEQARALDITASP
ncbi:type IV pilus biogenesis/stability protein PilW [Dyella sp.]|uniref:type IV pilus biogenesis/stability protein PilW n=1 Tax=Dyella sp. TaxID=1869338 RepID=UPI002ED26C87